MDLGAVVAWQGRFGDADLKIEVPPNGRIHAEWTTQAGTRTKVVDSIEQLERSVLFQLMVGGNVTEEMREEVADAVAITLANRTPVSSGQQNFQARRPPRKRPGGPRRGPGPRRRGGGRPRRRR